MIELTRLNDKKVVINCELIEYVEANPDTVISLTTGNKFVVKENIEETIQKVIEYKRKIFVENWQHL
jgi:flagellar protein FlbD